MHKTEQIEGKEEMPEPRVPLHIYPCPGAVPSASCFSRSNLARPGPVSQFLPSIRISDIQRHMRVEIRGSSSDLIQ